jgi:putative isomerase
MNDSFSINPIDISETPFSCYGSYMSIMVKEARDTHARGVYIQDISGRRMWQWKGVFRIDLLSGNKVAKNCTTRATYSKLRFDSPSGHVEICFQDANTIRMRGTSAMRLTQTVRDGSSFVFPVRTDHSIWRLQMGGYDHYALTAIRGQVTGTNSRGFIAEKVPEGPMAIIDISPDASGRFEMAFEQYNTGWRAKKSRLSFGDCVRNVEESIRRFSGFLPPAPSPYRKQRELAVYLKWMSFVNRKGLITRAVSYCSKNSMTAIWSWDNCFTAMTLAYGNLPLALNQLKVFFDHQHPMGHFPDHITDQQYMWGFTKPPIHGLCFQKMREYSRKAIPRSVFHAMYEPIARYTEFWFKYMDDDGNGIPQINHAADAGADNVAEMEIGYPVEYPPLICLLILQCDELARIATEMGLVGDRARWEKRSKRLLGHLVSELWVDGRFRARNILTKKTNPRGWTFYSYWPLVLGDKLPRHIAEKMIADIRDPDGIVTPEGGPASEHPGSPYFRESGYARGAVWAYHYFFLIEGLKRCGETGMALHYAKKYCELCRKNGFPENFSALTGKPQSDSGYAWTCEVFLMLCNEYLCKPRD